MSDETLFESEGEATSAETATMLRELADALEEGTPIELVDGDRSVAIDAPTDLVVEVELEREPGDDGNEVELELELEWTATGEISATGGEVEARAAESDATGEEDRPDEAAADESTTETTTEPTAGAADDAAATSAIRAGGDSQSMARFQVFRDRADEWRWRLVHRNGNVIATSGEGYTTRRNAEKGLGSVVKNAPGADVEEEF